MNTLDAIRFAAIITAMGTATALGMYFANAVGGADGLVLFLTLYCLLGIVSSLNPPKRTK